AKPQEEILDKACIEVTFAPDVGLIVALIDAGIPIFQIITASSCCIMDDNSIVLCPTNKQKTIAKSFHTFVFSGNESDSPVYINSLGTFDLSEFESSQAACREHCTKIYSFLVQKLESSSL
ncbi:hypothetical protein BB560_006346, partial [Smittium megazygosporum]